ncbi:MAG: zinc ribbon domain-containing protein [Lachnospiraceae bacterium]|nr:zinc ribbon domain-containing protein [Lachnospiraceae bacterium]
MYACPNCGSNIKFDPATQKMKCSYCDTMISPHDYMSAKSADEEKGIDLAEDEYEITYYTCPQCGGELITEDTTAATFCSYCGASTILEMRVGKEKKPDYIIPFKKTKEDCIAEYRKVLRRAIFAPSELRKDETIERFRGIYMPYWIYDTKSKGRISTKGSISRRRGDYIYTKRYNVKADVEVNYGGISYDASSSFEDRLSEAIAPFDLKDSDYFTSAYFSGFYADTSDVSSSLYDDEAGKRVAADAADKVYKNPEFKKYGVDRLEIMGELENQKSSVKHKIGMFPVWFLANQHGDRVSYAVVNGQTGKVAMDLPLDIKKYFIGCAVIAIPLFLLLILSNILITPNRLLLLTIAISVVVLILANKQANLLFARELLFSDKGYNSKKSPEQILEDQKKLAGNVKIKKPKIKAKSGALGLGSAFAISMLIIGFTSQIFGAVGYALGLVTFVFFMVISVSSNTSAKKNIKEKIIVKAPVGRKIGTTIFPIITISIAGLILLLQPASDAFYYGTAITGMVMTGIAVAKLVASHNVLTSRKLPQFNKRGGEEHEND